MPLVNTQPGNRFLYVDCLCGKRSNNHEDHYIHIVTVCKLDRCMFCFNVLGGSFGDNPDTHRCKGTRNAS